MKSDMENNEWADEEMSLKQVNKNNPFAVPSGYFEEAGQRILFAIKLDELKTSNPAQGLTVPENYFDNLTANIQSRIAIETYADAGQPGFAVPQNYFEQLTGNIQSRINIEAAAGADAESFTVPSGYFDNLTANIQSRIAVEEAAGAEAESFTVPAGYFDNLAANIQSRIAVEEAFEANTEAFTVPAGYFDALNKNIINKTVNQEVVIRKTIIRKLFASNTFKYATAACVTLMIGAGVFFRQPAAPVQHTASYLHTQLSEVPVDEIKNYLELNIDPNDTHGLMDDKQINTQVLDDELQDYIDIN